MKRIWIFIVALILCLSACGDNAPTGDKGEAENKGSKPTFTFPTQNTVPDQPTKPTEMETGTKPSDNLLREDLQDSLMTHIEKGFADTMMQTISEFTVVLSQTEEKLYTASLTVLAQSAYTDFTWPADVTYTKYDQGWVMTECTWGEYTSGEPRRPSEKEVQQFWKEYDLEFQDDGEFSEVLYNNTEMRLRYACSVSADWAPYITWSGYTITDMDYDLNKDQWEVYSDTLRVDEYSFLCNLEGLHGKNENETITIKNATGEGFDIEISAENVSCATTHLYRSYQFGTTDGCIGLAFAPGRNEDSVIDIVGISISREVHMVEYMEGKSVTGHVILQIYLRDSHSMYPDFVVVIP